MNQIPKTERLKRLNDQIERCALHYKEPEKYPPEDTMRNINILFMKLFFPEVEITA